MNKSFVDLTGKKFGKLTVIKKSKLRSSGGNIKWECICDCGKKTNPSSSHLVHGKSTSCGCNRRAKNPELSAHKDMFQDYKYSAQQRNLEFSLNFENDFLPTILENCIYCNQSPELRIMHRSWHYEYRANGIDRIDSQKGYNYENIVPCCATCNRMKNNMSFEKFKEHILKLANKFQKSNFFN